MIVTPPSTGRTAFAISSHGSRNAATVRGNHPPLSEESHR